MENAYHITLRARDICCAAYFLASAFGLPRPPPPQPIAERDKKHCYPRYHHFRKLNEHHFKFPFLEDNK